MAVNKRHLSILMNGHELNLDHEDGSMTRGPFSDIRSGWEPDRQFTFLSEGFVSRYLRLNRNDRLNRGTARLIAAPYLTRQQDRKYLMDVRHVGRYYYSLDEPIRYMGYHLAKHKSRQMKRLCLSGLVGGLYE